MSDLTNISEMSKDLKESLVKHYKCALIHSRIPERQEDGSIKWVCKEGCDKEKIKYPPST
jgi:adenine C2-methylase RlmN of 23S rRNA A2503 and tRNA A37